MQKPHYFIVKFTVIPGNAHWETKLTYLENWTGKLEIMSKIDGSVVNAGNCVTLNYH
jgi:hypothetical protein